LISGSSSRLRSRSSTLRTTSLRGAPLDGGPGVEGLLLGLGEVDVGAASKPN
jgi:hypothetical protein